MLVASGLRVHGREVEWHHHCNSCRKYQTKISRQNKESHHFANAWKKLSRTDEAFGKKRKTAMFLKNNTNITSIITDVFIA